MQYDCPIIMDIFWSTTELGSERTLVTFASSSCVYVDCHYANLIKFLSIHATIALLQVILLANTVNGYASRQQTLKTPRLSEMINFSRILNRFNFFNEFSVN